MGAPRGGGADARTPGPGPATPPRSRSRGSTSWGPGGSLGPSRSAGARRDLRPQPWNPAGKVSGRPPAPARTLARAPGRVPHPCPPTPDPEARP